MAFKMFEHYITITTASEDGKSFLCHAIIKYQVKGMMDKDSYTHGPTWLAMATMDWYSWEYG